jgi:hypothetical protein
LGQALLIIRARGAPATGIRCIRWPAELLLEGTEFILFLSKLGDGLFDQAVHKLLELGIGFAQAEFVVEAYSESITRFRMGRHSFLM